MFFLPAESAGKAIYHLTLAQLGSILLATPCIIHVFTQLLTNSSKHSFALTCGVMQLPESVLDAAASVVAHGAHVTGLTVPARGSFATDSLIRDSNLDQNLNIHLLLCRLFKY